MAGRAGGRHRTRRFTPKYVGLRRITLNHEERICFAVSLPPPPSLGAHSLVRHGQPGIPRIGANQLLNLCTLRAGLGAVGCSLQPVFSRALYRRSGVRIFWTIRFRHMRSLPRVEFESLSLEEADGMRIVSTECFQLGSGSTLG